jgi:predicted RNA-binding Zn-ribbon protein involved in translation (DUF1610 family)
MKIEYLDFDCDKCGSKIPVNSMYLTNIDKLKFYCENCAEDVLEDAANKGSIKIY